MATIKLFFLKAILRSILWSIFVGFAGYLLLVFIATRTHLFKEEVESQLSHLLNADIKIESISGMITFINPKITLSSVTIQSNNSANKNIQRIKKITATINLIHSIWAARVLIDQLYVKESTFFLVHKNNIDNNISREVSDWVSKLNSIKSLYIEDVHLFQVDLSNPKNDHTLHIKQLSLTQHANELILRSLQKIDDALSNIAGTVTLTKSNDIAKVFGYIKINPFNLMPWLRLIFPEDDLRLLSKKWLIQGTNWLTWTPEKWSLTSQFKTQDTSIHLKHKMLELSELTGTAWLDGSGKKVNTAYVLLDDFSLNKQRYNKQAIIMQSDLSHTDDKLLIKLPELSVEAICNVLRATNILSDTHKNLLSKLNLNGTLHDINIEIFRGFLKNKFSINAMFQNIKCNAWNKIPGIQGLNGQIKMNNERGVASIDSHDVILDFPDIFEKAIPFRSMKGDLHWNIQKDYWQLFSSRLDVRIASNTLNSDAVPDLGMLNIKIPFSTQAAAAEVGLGFVLSNVSAETIQSLYPLKKLDPSLKKWMKNSCSVGTVKEMRFLWHHILESKKAFKPAWSVLAEIDNMSLHYSDQWPDLTHVDTTLKLNQNGLSLENATGFIFDSQLKELKIDIEGWKETVVQVSTNSRLKGSDITAILQQSILNSMFKTSPEKWRFVGFADVDFKMSLPINKIKSADVTLTAKLDQVEYQLSSQNMTVKDLTGQLTYTSQKGLNSQALTASFLEAPIALNITTSLHDKLTRIMFKGKTEIDPLSRFIFMDLTRIAEGFFEYEADLKIHYDTGNMTVDCFSDLKNTALHLPSLYAKQKSDDMDCHVSIEFEANKKTSISFKYGSVIEALWGLQLNKFSGGEIIFHPASKRVIQPVQGELRLSGQFDELDIYDWYEWYKQYITQVDNSSFFNKIPVTLNQIHANFFKYKDYSLTDFDVSGTLLGDSQSPFSLFIQSQEIKGQLIKQVDLPYLLDLNYLMLSKEHLNLFNKYQKFNEPADLLKPMDSALTDLNLNLLSACEINVETLVLDQEHIGSFSAHMNNIDKGLAFNNINAELYNVTTTGDLNWILEDSSIKTSFAGNVTANSFESVSKLLDVDIPLSMKKLELALQMEWVGDPYHFHMQNAKGEMSFKLNSGKLKTNFKKGPLQFLGVLNADTLGRRLRLDFSDLTDSGIAFDYIVGEAVFEEGLIDFNLPLKFSGPSLTAQLEGVLDAVGDQVDMTMTVMLPVTQNLSLLTLLLGQPFLSGGLYLLSKLAGKTFMKASGMHYVIEGSLLNPIITADKIFDNKFKSNLKLDNKSDELFKL